MFCLAEGAGGSSGGGPSPATMPTMGTGHMGWGWESPKGGRHLELTQGTNLVQSDPVPHGRDGASQDKASGRIPGRARLQSGRSRFGQAPGAAEERRGRRSSAPGAGTGSDPKRHVRQPILRPQCILFTLHTSGGDT